MSDLPEGWIVRRVEDIFRSFSGGTPNRGNAAFWRGRIPWLSSGDIKSDTVQTSSEFITREGLESSSAKLCPPNSVVVVVRSGILKHTLPVAVLAQSAAINQDIKCFDSGNADLNHWLALALRNEARKLLALNREGTTVQSVKYETLKKFELRIPPLNEQQRIVAKLEEVLGIVDACQKRLAKIPVIVKRFRQSVLAAACSGRLTTDCREKPANPHWEEKTLGELILEKPKNGYSAKPVKYRTPFRVLTLTATTSGEFKPEHFKYFDGPIGADSGLWLQPNDILVQRGNTIEYVGVPAIYDGHPNEFIYPDLMMRLRAGPEVDSKFLYFALSWERSRSYLRKKATGTAGSMPKINQQTLITLPIDLPTLTEQREIVCRVQALLKFADQIEDRYKKAQAQVDKLTQSILAKAFRGELVPTEAELARLEGRDYEPASALLERIREENGESAVSSSTPGPRRSRAKGRGLRKA